VQRLASLLKYGRKATVGLDVCGLGCWLGWPSVVGRQIHVNPALIAVGVACGLVGWSVLVSCLCVGDVLPVRA
jgi:hypothetical protein